MFEVGKNYGIIMWEPGDGGTIVRFTACVTEISLPLISFKGIDIDGSPERIVNTSSLAFISATKLFYDPDKWLKELVQNTPHL